MVVPQSNCKHLDMNWLTFSITYHKIHGQTVNKIILDLNSSPSKALDLPSVYVGGISRVRNSSDMRILPLKSVCWSTFMHFITINLLWIGGISIATKTLTITTASMLIIIITWTLEENSKIRFHINRNQPFNNRHIAIEEKIGTEHIQEEDYKT